MSVDSKLNRDWHGRLVKPDQNSFKKGLVPWNKGTRGLTKNPMKGKKMPKEWRDKVAASREGIRPAWMDSSRAPEIWAKIAKSNSGKFGALSPHWKGGLKRANGRLRREKVKQNGGSHTVVEWETLKAQYNWTCPCCHKSEPEIVLTEDHIIPLSKGGSHNIENIQPLCKMCNMKKFTKIIKYDHVS